MFPLWRKRRTFVMMANRIVCGDGRYPLVVQPAGMQDGALDLALADAMHEARGKGRRKLSATIVVSDSFAAIVELPWQPALLRSAEIDRYAEAQFERSGQALGADWVMFSYFRHFEANGMAYAFPASFVQRLQEVAVASDVVIEAILPLSAFAYARLRRPRGGRCALVVREPSRISALVTDLQGLTMYATEPVVVDPMRSVERLLRRLQADEELDLVQELVLEAQDASALGDVLARTAPAARHAVTDLGLWRSR